MVASPPCPYLLFLYQDKKRRQKKIKASAEAEEVDRVYDGALKMDRGIGMNIRSILKMYQEKLPCPGRGLVLIQEKKAKENQGPYRG